jgi:large subunit ribosomal protein L4
MKVKVIGFDAKESGEVSLNKDIFGVTPRADILHRVVEWQRAKARAGTHKTKTVSEISGTTAKPWAQKGTGRARAGSLRSPQFRGGAVIFGPVVRSHAYSLPKKVRALGLKMALSTKAQENNLVILKDSSLKSAKTKDFTASLKKLGWKSALIIDGATDDENLQKASGNLHKINIVPTMGANVLDILKHETLVITQSGLAKLEERLA